MRAAVRNFRGQVEGFPTIPQDLVLAVDAVLRKRSGCSSRLGRLRTASPREDAEPTRNRLQGILRLGGFVTHRFSLKLFARQEHELHLLWITARTRAGTRRSHSSLGRAYSCALHLNSKFDKLAICGAAVVLVTGIQIV